MEMGYCAEHGIPHSEFLEWSDEDRAKVLAWVAESALRCQMCGTGEWEWEGNRFAYEPYSHICPGCEKIDLVQDDPDRERSPGEYIRLRDPNVDSQARSESNTPSEGGPGG